MPGAEVGGVLYSKHYEVALLLSVGREAVVDLSNQDLRLQVLNMVLTTVCSIKSYKHIHT